MRAQSAAGDPYTMSGSMKQSHAGRHIEFARFLAETFGVGMLRGGGDGVVDVAGGRGGLAFDLFARYGITCTILEARPSLTLKSHQRRYLSKLRRKAEEERESSTATDAASSPPPPPPIRHIHALLDDTFMQSAEGSEILRRCSALVGMHCDEATEPLVRAALHFNKPFAVVPCCVFPSFHPHRRLSNGSRVETTEAFCRYLLELAPGSESTYLPFEGRNKVIFRRPAAADTCGAYSTIPAPPPPPRIATSAARDDAFTLRQQQERHWRVVTKLSVLDAAEVIAASRRRSRRHAAWSQGVGGAIPAAFCGAQWPWRVYAVGT